MLRQNATTTKVRIFVLQDVGCLPNLFCLPLDSRLIDVRFSLGRDARALQASKANQTKRPASEQSKPSKAPCKRARPPPKKDNQSKRSVKPASSDKQSERSKTQESCTENNPSASPTPYKARTLSPFFPSLNSMASKDKLLYSASFNNLLS